MAGSRTPAWEFCSGKPAGAPGIRLMACRVLKIQVESRTNADGRSAGAGVKKAESCFTGSVVGIHFEVVGMYTGTTIRDLMAAVERAELRSE